MYSSTPPFQLGQTSKGTNPDTGVLIAKGLLGRQHRFPCRDYSSATPRTNANLLTGKDIVAVCLRNVSGGSLSGKRLGACDVGQSGSNTYGLVEQVSGYATGPASGLQVAIDPFLSSGGVADDDLFWGVISGVVPLALPDTGEWTGGDIAVGDPLMATTAGKLVRATGQAPLDLERFRIWDAVQTNLTTAANDDLGFVGAGVSVVPTIQGGDGKATTISRFGRTTIRVPDDYKPGAYLAVTFTAGMLTTISDGTATIDMDARVRSSTGVTASSDLCETAAQSINSLTFSDKKFVITPTGIQPGDLIDIRVNLAVTDSATGTAVIPVIASGALVYGLASVGRRKGLLAGYAVQARTENDNANGTVLCDLALAP